MKRSLNKSISYLIFGFVLIQIGFCDKSHEQLFNGKDLSGWKATAHPDLWSVESGEIVGRWDDRKNDVAHSFLVHEGRYSDFHLTFEVLLKDNIGNSGVQFRSHYYKNHPRQIKGYQADIGPGWWGKLYHEHGAGVLWKKSGEPFVKKGQWNQYEIIAIGNKIQTRINGQISVHYIDPKERESEGFFAIQLHWGLRAKEIRFRKFNLNLEPSFYPVPALVTAEGLIPGEESPIKMDRKHNYPIRSQTLDQDQLKQLKGKVDSAKFNDKRLGSNSRSANLSPEEQKKQFILQEGFVAELVASEQMGIKKIVDIAFDSSGRMWAVTASEYPADSMGSEVPFHLMLKGQGVNRPERVKKLWSEGGIDQILLFENPCAKEGEVKNPIIFSEGHAMPVGVLPYKQGVLVIEGERLKYLSDQDGDLRADHVKLLAEGFGAQDTHTGAHGLKFMPGEWVTILNGVLNWGSIKDASGKVTPYYRSGTAYIKPDGHDFHLVQKGLQNIWGFYLSPEGETWMHEANNVGYPLVPFYEQMTLPMTAGKEDFLRDYMHIYPPTGRINLDGSSLSGLERSDDLAGGFPKPWQDCYFIAHPGPNKIHSVKVEKRKDQSYNVLRGVDFIQSKDPNFRPVDLEFGPDGCLYIVDWYNRVIDHNGVSRDHPARNKDYSRIWRIRHQSQTPSKIKNLKRSSIQEVLQSLNSKNSWELHHAWRQLAERKDKSVIKNLESMVLNKSLLPRFRIHALWSLESMGVLDLKLFLSLLKDEDKHIRYQVLRSLSNSELDTKLVVPVLQKHVLKEKDFEVKKVLFNYFIKIKALSSDQITWLMEFVNEPLELKGRAKAIWHETLSWAEYKDHHISDLVRMSLDSHPNETIAYLNREETSSQHKHYLKKYVLPYLKSGFEFSQLSQDDLKNLNLRSLVLAQSGRNKDAMELVRKYYASGEPTHMIKELLKLDSPCEESHLDDLLAPNLKKIEKDIFISEEKAILYLKSLVLAKSVLKNSFRQWSPVQILLRDNNQFKLSKQFPKTSVWLARLSLAYFQTKDFQVVEKSTQWLQILNRQRIHKRLKRRFIDQVLQKWSVQDLETFMNIISEEAYALAHTLNCLNENTELQNKISKTQLSFYKDRYDRFANDKHQIAKIPRKGYFMLNGLNKEHKKRQLNKFKQESSRIKNVLENKTIKADLKIGKSLFQGLCLSCHQIGQQGAGIAPSLDGVGNRHTAELISAVVNPDLAIESNYKATRVQMVNGQIIQGLAQTSSDGISMTFMGGGVAKLNKTDVAYTQKLNQSFMPSELTSGLDDQALKNLFVYLTSLK